MNKKKLLPEYLTSHRLLCLSPPRIADHNLNLFHNPNHNPTLDKLESNNYIRMIEWLYV